VRIHPGTTIDKGTYKGRPLKLYKQPTPPEMDFVNSRAENNPRGYAESEFWRMASGHNLNCYFLEGNAIDHELNPPLWIYTEEAYIILGGEPIEAGTGEEKLGGADCRMPRNIHKKRPLNSVGILTTHPAEEEGPNGEDLYIRAEHVELDREELLKIDCRQGGERHGHIWRGAWALEVIAFDLPDGKEGEVVMSKREGGISPLKAGGMALGVIGAGLAISEVVKWAR